MASGVCGVLGQAVASPVAPELSPDQELATVRLQPMEELTVLGQPLIS